MSVIGVIPARYKSTRFEGKVLATVRGKSVLQHTHEGAGEACLLDELIVATDDVRIQNAAQKFGAQVVMTSASHPSGMDRIAEVIQKREHAEIIVNIQGDEPLITGTMIDEVVKPLLENGEHADMVTLAHRIEQNDDLTNPNVVKVVLDKNGYALYFSRAPIPFKKEQDRKTDGVSSFYRKHIGIYAYRRSCLLRLVTVKPSALEQIEGLEQLRALEEGYRIKVVDVEEDTVGVDTPEDLEQFEKALKKRKA